jgi:hypothetical protein
MAELNTLIGVALFILFLPFIISLLGQSIFALLAFISTCGVLWFALLSLIHAAASLPPDPERAAEEAVRADLRWGLWLGAWIFAGIGIWRKYQRKRKARPRPPPTVFIDHLRGKDAAYFNADGE